MRVQELAIYIDFKTDESYTPSRLSIKAGNSFYQLQEIKSIEFEEPVGWFTFNLAQMDQHGDMIK